jgi:DNA-binding NarL/FixJ family response regulator
MQTETKTVQVFIAEQHPLMLGAYERCAQDLKDMAISGTHLLTPDSDLASEVAAKSTQVLVLGCNTLDDNVPGFVRSLMKSDERPALIILASTAPTSFDDDLRTILRDWGSSLALLSKQAVLTTGDFQAVVRQVMEGRIVIDTATSEGLFNQQSADSGSMKKLTAREIEVLDLVAAGYRNLAIADALFLEPKTIERHLHNIYTKVLDGEDDRMHPRVFIATQAAAMKRSGAMASYSGHRSSLTAVA